MASMHTEERVGEAWKQHRMGNHDSAIDIFRDILNKHADHLDALYGLGLAQRAKGDVDGAIESFNKAMQLAQEALSAIDKTSMVDGYRGANNLDTYEDDRHLMMQRMISQRLNELNAG